MIEVVNVYDWNYEMWIYYFTKSNWIIILLLVYFSRDNSRLSQGSRDSRSTFSRPSRSSFLSHPTRDRSLSRDRSLTRDKPVGRSSSLTRGRSMSRDNRNSTLRNRSSSRESLSSARGGERVWNQQCKSGSYSARESGRGVRERSLSREKIGRDRSNSRERPFTVQRRSLSPSCGGRL